MLRQLNSDTANIDEDKKLGDEYLKAQIDASINSISGIDKKEIQKAFDVRNGIRNAEDFEYLWKAYGIEFPSQFRHIPVLRSIFDSLVGQYINRPFKWQISSSDEDTIAFMFDEYRDAIYSEIEQYYVNQITAAQFDVNKAGQAGERAKQYLSDLQKKFGSGKFVSIIEKQAKTMMEWAIQRFKAKSELIDMFYDFHTSGQCFYQVKVEQIGKKPLVRCVNGLNLYFTKAADDRNLRGCDRVVLKEKLFVTEVWTRYGHKMSQSDREKFLSDYNQYIVGSEWEIVGYEFGTLEYNNEYHNRNKGLNIPEVEVCYVEWLDNTKVPMTEVDEINIEGNNVDKQRKLKTRYKYRLDRYQGTRIEGAGGCIYIDYGRDKFVVRDPDDESRCHLSINGAFYNDRNGKPYSLPLKTKDIADKIDILHYHAENLLAISGSKAVTVNFPDIPVWMGSTPQQRVMTYLGYVKQGLNLVDTSQEGGGKFNNFGDVDMSLSQSIITIYDMLDRLEATAHKITGVPRQSVGNITQSDGKGTTELAIQGSETVLQPLFSAFDELAEMFLTDLVNACRMAYSEGLQGQLILGKEGQRFFSIKNKKFNLAHLNVWVNNEGFIQRDLDDVKATAMSLIDNGLLDPSIAIKLVTEKSLTGAKELVEQADAEKKEEAKQQTQQQLEQSQEEIANLTAALQKLEQKISQQDQLKLQYDQQNKDRELELKEKDLTNRNINDTEKLRLDSKRVDLEALQLSYGTSGNKEIKNN